MKVRDHEQIPVDLEGYKLSSAWDTIHQLTTGVEKSHQSNNFSEIEFSCVSDKDSMVARDESSEFHTVKQVTPISLLADESTSLIGTEIIDVDKSDMGDEASSSCNSSPAKQSLINSVPLDCGDSAPIDSPQVQKSSVVVKKSFQSDLYKCSKCQKAFKYLARLNNHI